MRKYSWLPCRSKKAPACVACWLSSSSCCVQTFGILSIFVISNTFFLTLLYYLCHHTSNMHTLTMFSASFLCKTQPCVWPCLRKDSTQACKRETHLTVKTLKWSFSAVIQWSWIELHCFCVRGMAQMYQLRSRRAQHNLHTSLATSALYRQKS